MVWKLIFLVALALLTTAKFSNNINLSDAVAVIGKPFRYDIPTNAVHSIRNLPDSLTYHTAEHAIVGVLSLGDLGRHEVQIGDNVITITVVEEDFNTLHDGNLRFRRSIADGCKKDEPIAVLQLLLDVDMAEIEADEREAILERFSALTGMNIGDARLWTKSYSDQLEITAVETLPGELTTGTVEKPTYVSMITGCGDYGISNGERYLNHFGPHVAGGDIGVRIGYKTIEWRTASGIIDGAARESKYGTIDVEPPKTTEKPDLIGELVSSESTMSDEGAKKTTAFTFKVTATVTKSDTVDEIEEERTSRSTEQPPTVENTTPMTTKMPETTTTAATTTPTTTSTKATTTPRTTPAPATTQTTTRKTTTASTRAPTTTRRQTEATTTVPTTTTARPTTTSTTPAPAPRQPTIVRKPGDMPPANVKPLANFDCVRGELCKLEIPADTFSDAEDGTAYDLTLTLTPIDENQGRQWLKLTEANVMVGVPMTTGVFNMKLIATDSNMQSAVDAFEITVHSPLSTTDAYSHSLQMTIDTDYDEFVANEQEPLRLIRRLAKALGDADPSKITLTSLTRGSVVVAFSNSSLPLDSCDKSSIMSMFTSMAGRDATETSTTPSDAFVRRMRPKYTVTKVGMHMTGACVATPIVDASKEQTGITKEPIYEETEPTTGESTWNALLSTLIPAAVVVVLLFAACLIACCCYCRHRGRSHKLQEEREAQSAYVSKGMPVMFPEEMQADDDSMATATQPMLIHEDRPPLTHTPTVSIRARSTPQRSIDGHDSALATSTPRHTPARVVMTEHENPMYKPLDMHNRSSPRMQRHLATLPGQRQPPPYLPS